MALPLLLLTTAAATTRLCTEAFLLPSPLPATRLPPPPNRPPFAQQPFHRHGHGLLLPSSCASPTSTNEDGDAAALAAANDEWVEPWAGAESNDMVRIVFDCYDDKDTMVIDPWLLSELLLETGAFSSQIEDAAKDTTDETPIFGEHGEPAWGEKIWARSAVMADYGLDVDVGGVLALVKEAFQLDEAYLLRYRLERIVDRDWQKEVQEGWKPLLLGNRLLVKFTWHREEDVRPFLEQDRTGNHIKVMTLEGGAAFGSGEHPTTHMCCAWLQEHLAQHPSGLSMCDYGSGSGVLALAALMFGAASAVGVEIDPFAIQSAYRNAEMNGLETVFLLPLEEKQGSDMRVAYRVVEPDGSIEEEDVNVAPTDVMVANILKRPLIELSKKIASLTKPGTGKIILAGLLEEQAESVMAAYRPYFPDMRVARTMANGHDQWALLEGTRNDVAVQL